MMTGSCERSQVYDLSNSDFCLPSLFHSKLIASIPKFLLCTERSHYPSLNLLFNRVLGKLMSRLDARVLFPSPVTASLLLLLTESCCKLKVDFRFMSTLHDVV